jgi:type II secretory pathway pseudopilin PulG
MEMLVVFFIISIGLYGVVTLIFSNVALQEQDLHHIIAMNLAREGLEIAQNVRDSNWLAGVDFDMGLGTDTGADCTAVPDWDGTGFPVFDFSVDDIANGVISASGNSNSLGMFTNQSGTSTAYSRLLTFAPICADPADRSLIQVSSACTCTDPTFTEKIGVRVKADMAWIRKGTASSLTIYSDLYDWR